MYLVMVLAYGVMALLIAIPLGVQGARALSSTLAVFFNFEIHSLEVPPQTFLIQVAIGLILPVLASLVPFISSLRISAFGSDEQLHNGQGTLRQKLDRSALSGAIYGLRGIFPSARFVVGEKYLPQQGQFDFDFDHAYPGFSHLHQRLPMSWPVLSSTVEDIIKWFKLRHDAHPRPRLPRGQGWQLEATLNVPGMTKTDVWIQLPTRRIRLMTARLGMIYMFAPTIHPESLIRSPTITEGRCSFPVTILKGDAVVVPSPSWWTSAT